MKANSYAFHALQATIPDGVLDNDHVLVWENIYITMGEDEWTARDNLLEYFNEHGILTPSPVIVDGKNGNVQYVGIRQVVECDSDFRWSDMSGEKAVEITYLEYRVKYATLKKLSEGRDSVVTFLEIARRSERGR